MKQFFIFSVLFMLLQNATIAQSLITAPSGKSAFTLYGVRGGINITRIKDGSEVGITNRLGYHAGILFDKHFDQLKGMRHEVSYSREKFIFNNSVTGTTTLKYFHLTNLFTLNFGNAVQLQAGVQTSFLAKAMVDTVKHILDTDASKVFSVLRESNRFSYGVCAGVEVYPYKGLLIGIRYNTSFTPINKSSRSGDRTSAQRSVITNGQDVRLKNQVIQISAGWRFGNDINKKK